MRMERDGRCANDVRIAELTIDLRNNVAGFHGVGGSDGAVLCYAEHARAAVLIED
jgi:hypothetical protein